MELSVSLLSIKENVSKRVNELNKLNIDYLHIDVMDGQFVSNKTDEFEVVKKNLENNKKKLDVHLMVKDVESYINQYKQLNPEYITIHYEICDNIERIIKYIKDNNIKVGISIKPSTDVALLLPYLDQIDLVLVMTVNPGKGGQQFMKNMDYKIKDLIEMRKNSNLNYKIEVDGGINNDTIRYVKDVDIVVVGSYITCSDNYKKRIQIIRGD